MDILVKKDISNNVYSVTMTVKSWGTETLSDIEEKALVDNFTTSISYKDMSFTKNITVNGAVEVTDDPADDETVRTISVPSLINKNITIDDNFVAEYKVDSTKIPLSAVDGKVLKNQNQVAEAYCVTFIETIREAVGEKMENLRTMANTSFECEEIISV